MIDGVPIMETAFRRDPELPRSDSGNVIDILRPVLDRPLAWIPLDQVRAGLNALSARLVRLRGTVAIADAETDADLAALVDAALAIEASPLLVGSAGLARALAARLGLLIEHVPLPSVGRWLIVAGSRHPATRRQVETARAAARRALDQERFDLVAVTGGGTAIRLFEALGAERFDLVGPPAPGLAFGWLRSPSHPDLAVLTKAGSFGAPDLFVSLRDEALA